MNADATGPTDGAGATGRAGATGAVGRTDNSVWIDADIDFVWAATNDVARWPALFTEYAAAEILERHGDTVRFRLTRYPDADGTVWSWVSERTMDAEHHHVRAHRVETGPFEFMNIEWTYEPEGGGTRMRWIQDFRMRPAAPVDDEWMTANINRNTREQMVVIRAKVEAEARAATGAATRAPASAPLFSSVHGGTDPRS